MSPLTPSRFRACAAVVLFTASGAALAEAQVTCLPVAVGVPGASGPPIWWAGPTPAVFAEKIDDPRWHGAVAHSFGDGADEQVKFRGLSRSSGGASELFLSWHVKVDPTLEPQLDVVYVGFEPAVGNPIMLQVTPFLDIGSSFDAQPASVQARQWTGTSWATLTTPAWAAARTYAWLVNTAPYEWAVHMHVPVSTAATDLNLPTTFRMWYEVQVHAGTGSIAYHWPRDVMPIHTAGPTTVYPAVADWGSFRIAAGPGSPDCNVGVLLASSDVGTTNTPPSQINLTSPNTFYARPLNQTGAPIGAGQLQARFRIANWGSTPNRHDVADPSQLWAPIPTAASVHSNTSPIANGAKGEISFSWTVPAAMRAEFESGARRMHQCMLVELSSSAGITLLKSSVYRNMDFVSASTFRREAEISVVGLRRQADAHEVLLFQSRRLMPARVEQPGRPGVQQPGRQVALPVPPVDIRGISDTSRINRLRELSRLSPERLEVLYRQGGAAPDDLMRVMPTYIVHVYRGDGLIIRKGNTNYPVLHPQTSYGYFVKHDGPLHGWSTSLQGASRGRSPDVYTVRIPRNGTVRITDIVTAQEEPVPGGTVPCPLGAGGTAATGFGLILLAFVHRRQRTLP
jgi:hypothetical protein